ncbi:MAG: Wzz/FepE/Etk N-terminal domain-containing protein [Streptosporangiaceae bacterium]
MTEQALDLRRSVRIVRRRWIAVVIVAVLGFLAGAGYAVLKPPTLVSSALVVLPTSTHDVPTQVVIADSDPVLSAALPKIKPAMSLQALDKKVRVRSLTSNIITISAEGGSPAQAEGNANAVADAYVSYVNNANSASGKVQARLLESATVATGRSLLVELPLKGGAGALLGALAGAIGALALGRGDRRLRERDEIANAIGVPVLASIPVDHPSDARQWARLLEEYEPNVSDAWRLCNALRYLGLADVVSAQVSNGSVTVLSLSSDRRALSLGPQLAALAASLGIPTALVVVSQQDMNATAALRAACEAPPSSRQSSQLRLAVADHDGMAGPEPDAMLTVIVEVLDSRAPRVADTTHPDATLIGVSAGGATSEQLASIAAAAAAVGCQIEGILVADPDSADRTTGRVPLLTRSAQRRMPTRLTGMPVRVNGTPTENRTTETRR